MGFGKKEDGDEGVDMRLLLEFPEGSRRMDELEALRTKEQTTTRGGTRLWEGGTLCFPISTTAARGGDGGIGNTVR